MILNYDKDNMPPTLVDKLSNYMNRIDIDKVTKTQVNLRVITLWLQALSEYSKFKKYCTENNIEFEMTYAEYPHGMFSANQYQSYLSNNLATPEQPNTVTQFNKSSVTPLDEASANFRRSQGKPDNFETLDVTEQNKLLVPSGAVKKKGNVTEVDL